MVYRNQEKFPKVMIVVMELGGLGKLFLHASKPLPFFYFNFLVAPQFVVQPGLNMGPLAVRINSPNH